MNFPIVCWQKMHALKFRGKKKNLVKFKSTVYGRKMHALKFRCKKKKTFNKI